MAGPLRAEEPGSSASPGIFKYVIVSVLALCLGFLTFNWSYIMRVTHAHVSLTHHHKAHAFCAFIGCRYTEDMQDIKVAPELTEAELKAKAEEEAKLKRATEMLSSRVCGSPAIDGYAHVVPKCLEDSPTNKWFMEYYASGGKQEDLVAHIEPASDYDGLAVVWGIGNKKTSAEECAAHCKRHMPNQVPDTIFNAGPFSHLPCNAFVWCPDDVCFEPDAHHHTKGDCWLKFTEGPAYPEINMRGDLPDDFRKRHPTAPKRVQWHSGVLLPKGVKLTNGTWGPRWSW